MLSATVVHAFGLDDVAERAAKLASSPYQTPSGSVPKAIKALGYDQYRDIRFRPDRALWHNTALPFQIMFFHRGWFYEEPVTIHEVSAEGDREIPFDSDAFDYGKNKIDRDVVRGLGFAGFRVHSPVNRPRTRMRRSSFSAPAAGVYRSSSRPVSRRCSTSTRSCSCAGTSASWVSRR